jgi:hypothetical protein
MNNLRFLGLALGLFVAVFLGMKWPLTEQPGKPERAMPTFQHVDPDDPRIKQMQSSQSDDDAARDGLRHDVIDYAKALYDDPCNKALKAHYVAAVVRYVRAWTIIAPCLATRTCSNADASLLERARQAFGSPLDHRVRDAMQTLHAKATFGSGDFPQDTVLLVSDLAADGSVLSAHETREFRHVTAQFSEFRTRQDCGY